MRRHNWIPWTAVALVASLGGCGRPPQMPPMEAEVAVLTVQPQQAVLTTTLPGRTAAYRVAEIRPQVNGLIQKRLFTEGSRVNAGDLLYQIDPAPYQAAYDSAVANCSSAKEAAERARAAVDASRASLNRYQAVLKLANTNRDRYERLVKSSAASAMERDQAVLDVDVATAALKVGEAQIKSDLQSVEVAEAAIQQAEAAKETARINLAYTKITAPISGRIGRSNVTEGAIATAYQTVPLATIQELDPIYVDVPQSTAELSRLKRSLAEGHLKDNGTDRVKLVLEDGTAYPLEGSLQFRDVTVDPTTGSVILRIVMPNPDRILLPGMFVQAILEEGLREQAILVPQQAVARDPKGNPYALVVDAQDKIAQRSLVTERAMGDQWLVSSGLAQGDRVVVEGQQKAARPMPGMKIKVVPWEGGAKPASPVEKTAQSDTLSK